MTCSWRFLPRPPVTRISLSTFLSFPGLAVVDHLPHLAFPLLDSVRSSMHGLSFLSLPFLERTGPPCCAFLSMVGLDSSLFQIRGLSSLRRDHLSTRFLYLFIKKYVWYVSSDINDFFAPVSHSAFVKVSSNKIGTYGRSTGDIHIAESLIDD
ncbi:hypothetical protein TNCV_1234911 [Trichonephila clavipes]|nr:hypothetical protein TNCV_1234911 [Trichonephila clavipes]